MSDAKTERPIDWIGSSYEELTAFPGEVQDDIGFALGQVQDGKTPAGAKPLHGFHGATVMEIVSDYRTDAYRAVYVARFEDVVYVLHCFQKKAKRGSETPKPEIDLIHSRLKEVMARAKKK